MMIRISGCAEESIVDGPGIRLAIFAQGCSHNCPGCHNPSTHSINGGRLVDISSLAPLMDNPLLDGITLSGGEPFDQPEAMIELANEAKKRGLNIWAYTGYLFENLLNSKSQHIKILLEHIDVLVDGPFVLEERSLELLFKGSKNQRIIDVKESLLVNEILLLSFDEVKV